MKTKKAVVGVLVVASLYYFLKNYNDKYFTPNGGGLTTPLGKPKFLWF